jgi:phenylalanyl-tRNA synthetase beta chain
MEFLFSWLADHVDLGSDLALERDAAGRCALPRLDEGVRRKAFQLGEKLTAVGLAVEGIREVVPEEGGPDFVFDVEVTANRPDAMCHLGLARELAVALKTPLRRPDIPFYESVASDGTSGTVLLEDPESCPRYVARIVRGVKIGPSPEWLRRRLEAIGVRAINNVVDATNYVLWELGQPLHAFDLATLPGGEIRVRRARASERLTTLDGVERTLDPEILVIADRERAIGVAGVMGGLATEVTEGTTDVLLESAHFDRRRVRIGARRLGLHTDASHRFERGANLAICDEASRRCCALIVELAGGRVEPGAVDAIARPLRVTRWRLERAALARFLGLDVEGEEIERLLGGLGFAPERTGDGVWEGSVPSWREVDFEPRRGRPEPCAHPQDVYEEVLRHVGFESIPATLPALGGTDPAEPEGHARARRARRTLVAAGYAEAIHYAFQERAWDAAFPALVRAGEPLALANPLSERSAVLRRSLVPNLASAAELNARRGARGVRLFELGHLFPGGETPEIEAIAWIAGGAAGEPWDRLAEAELLTVKGAGEALLEELGARTTSVRAAELPGVLAGTGGEWLDGTQQILGWFGRLAAAETPFPLFAGELRLDHLPAGGSPARVAPPPRLPGIRADLTLTHALTLPWAEIARVIEELATPLLAGFRLVDRFRGRGVPEGAVATTIAFDYQGDDRTLTQEEVNERQAAIAAELERRFALPRREGT